MLSPHVPHAKSGRDHVRNALVQLLDSARACRIGRRYNQLPLCDCLKLHFYLLQQFGLWEIGESTRSSILFVPSERTKAPHRGPSRKRPSLSPNGPSSLPEKLTSSIWPWSDEAPLHCGKARFERKHHTFLSPKSVFEMWGSFPTRAHLPCRRNVRITHRCKQDEISSPSAFIGIATWNTADSSMSYIL